MRLCAASFGLLCGSSFSLVPSWHPLQYLLWLLDSSGSKSSALAMKIPPHDRALVDLGNHHPWFCWSSVVHHFSTNRDAELCHRRCCNCSSATYYVSLNGEHNSLALIINSSRVAGKLYRVSPKVWTLSN